jgi:hypothetical protein
MSKVSILHLKFVEMIILILNVRLLIAQLAYKISTLIYFGIKALDCFFDILANKLKHFDTLLLQFRHLLILLISITLKTHLVIIFRVILEFLQNLESQEMVSLPIRLRISIDWKDLFILVMLYSSSSNTLDIYFDSINFAFDEPI